MCEGQGGKELNELREAFEAAYEAWLMSLSESEGLPVASMSSRSLWCLFQAEMMNATKQR